jgi:hypothetical protein
MVNVLSEVTADMREDDAAGSAPQERPQEEEPAAAQSAEDPAEDPGYLTQTGEAVGDDGSVVPVIGGLPAVDGSAWDIGAPVDDRGAGLADEQQRSRSAEAGD